MINIEINSEESQYLERIISELSKPFLFDKDGQRSDNEWIIRHVLEDFIHFRVMTPGQLFRWLTYRAGKNHERIETIIREMLLHKLIISTSIKLPVQQDGRVRNQQTPTRNTTIISLNFGSKRILESHPDVRFARFGSPEGINLERVYHDVLITEACLDYSKNYNIIDIRCEDRLKKVVIAGRTESGSSECSGGESVPDFQVFLQQFNADGKTIFFDTVDGEIIVQSDREQIAVKSKSSTFFVANRRAADLVKSVMGATAVLLSDVAYPAQFEKLFYQLREEILNPNAALWKMRLQKISRTAEKPGGLSELQKYILVIIQSYGPLTAGAIAVITAKKRDQISRALVTLTETKLLQAADIQTQPGIKKGRPYRIFGFGDTELTEFCVRLKCLLLSISIEYLANKNYKTTCFLAAGNILCATKKDFTGNKIRFLIDEPQLSATEFAELYVDVESNSAIESTPCYFVPSTKDRFDAVHRLRPGIIGASIFD